MAHVLQFTVLRYPEIRGGVDTMVVNLVKGLSATERVSVFVPGDWEHARLATRVVDGIAVHTIRLRLPMDRRRPLVGLLAFLFEAPRTLLALRGLVRREGIDLIHAHVAKDFHFYLRLLRWVGGPPYVITLHRGDVVEFPTLRASSQRLVRFALGGAALVNAVSRWLARDAERLFPHIGPVAHVYNGLDLPAPERITGAPETPLGVPLPARYCVMVGSFDHYKGHDVAFRAFARLRTEVPDLHLLVIGEGDLREDYLALLATLGCADRVHLVGRLPHADVLRLMQGALVMVFPSRSEGFAYALLEAAAVGLAAVCTDIPAFAELIEDGVDGRLVPVEDEAALAAAVRALIEDAPLRARLAARLMQRVREAFTAEAMTRGYLALYARVPGVRLGAP